MFISSCYFIYNAPRDAVAEKEFNIVIQMTLERVLVQIQEKRHEWKKVKLSRVGFGMKETLRVFLSKVWKSVEHLW